MAQGTRLLFVDFNGVLSYDPYWKSLRNPAHPLHQFAEAIERFVFTEHSELFQRWMLGEYTAEAFHQMIAREVGVEYEVLFQSFVTDCCAIDVSSRILDALLAMKKDFRLILATGNTDALERFILPNNSNLFDVFHDIDNSFHIGRMKSADGGAYFLDRAAREGIPMHQAYLLEDSAGTCAVFRALGGHAFLVNTEEAALQALQEIGMGKC